MEHGPSCSEALWHAPWALPGPGTEAMSPVVAGVFSYTVPPGSPHRLFIYVCVLHI